MYCYLMIFFEAVCLYVNVPYMYLWSPSLTINLHSPFYSDFTMSYLVQDDYGKEIYLSMLSDWDMDAAIQSASDPCLQLKVDAKPFEEGL